MIETIDLTKKYGDFSALETLELNLEPSEGSRLFHESRLGPASQLVPAWVDEVLGG